MKTKIVIIFSLVLAVVFFAFNGPARAETYDLKAESLTMTSAKCEVNQVCTFSASVKNLGAGFNLNFPLKATISGTGFKMNSSAVVAPAQGAGINTNDHITFTINGQFSQIGTIVLNFSVSAAGYLSESDGNNNSASLSVSVAGYDLNVDSISFWPASPAVGQDCYLRVAVKNNSSYNLFSGGGLDSLRIFPDFNVISASSTEPNLSNVIASGGYVYYGYRGNFSSAGEKQLSFTIDPNDDLRESNSVNNVKTWKINVYNFAETDLALDSVSFSAAKIILGEPLDIIIGLKNTGKTSLTAPTGFSKTEFNFTLPYFDYGINDLTPDVYPALTAPLNPREIFHYKVHGAFSQPGSFNLPFSFNKDKQLTEANYLNDATSTAVMVYKNQAAADDFSILSQGVSLVSSTTALISWKTDIKTTGRVNYNQAHEYIYGNKIEDTISALNHAITINNLKPGENYIYSITAENGTAEKTEMMSNFSLPADDFLRITAGPTAAVVGKTASFSWSTNLISSSKVYYRKKGVSAVSGAGADTAVAEHKVELSNLAYGDYEYYVSSTSTAKTNVKTDWASFEIKEQVSAAPNLPAVAAETAVAPSAASLNATNADLYNRLKGKIILRVQGKGQAYYISAQEKKMYFLGKPADAFSVIRAQGVGISNVNLAKIPLGLAALSGADADADGLSDALEDALGTDKNKADTDADGYKDKDELAAGYSPLAVGKKMVLDLTFAAKQKGKIFLQVQSRGEAWYVNPNDGKRYFMAAPADAFNLMRALGAGVSESDFNKLTGQ